MDCTYPPYIDENDRSLGRQPMPTVRGTEHITTMQVYDLVVNWNTYITTGSNACSDGRALFVAHVANTMEGTGRRAVDVALTHCWENYNAQFAPACAHLGLIVEEPEPVVPPLRHLVPGEPVIWARNGQDYVARVIYDARTDPYAVHSAINADYVRGLGGGWESDQDAAVLLIFGDHTSTGGQQAHISWLPVNALRLE